MRTRVMAGLIGVSLAVASGCGGSGGGGPSKAAFVAKANALCQAENAANRPIQVKTFGPDFKRAFSVQDLAEYMKETVPLYVQEQEKWFATPFPKNDAGVIASFLAARGEVLGRYEQIAALADKSDPRAVQAALELGDPGAKVNEIAKRYGMTGCVDDN